MKSHEFSDNNNMSYEYDVKMIARGTKEGNLAGRDVPAKPLASTTFFSRLPATRRSLPAILSSFPLPSAHRPSPVTRRSTRTCVVHHPHPHPPSLITRHPSPWRSRRPSHIYTPDRRLLFRSAGSPSALLLRCCCTSH